MLIEEDVFNAYVHAMKLGQKAEKAAKAAGREPYLISLESILPNLNKLARKSLGILTVPIENIVGTATAGRSPAFADNFMPLMNIDTEFAAKWRSLYSSVLEEGVREAPKLLEYKNRYYAIEGNKRISVSRFLESDTIEADVSRVIPPANDVDKLYEEFLSFNDHTGILNLEFSKLGSYRKLCQIVGQPEDAAWSEQAVMDLKSYFARFRDVYRIIEPDNKPTPGDAFLLYLKAFGYNNDIFFDSDTIKKNLDKLKAEVNVLDQEKPVNLKLDAEGQKPGFIQQLIRPNPGQQNVVFINSASPDVSGWTYWHELGQNHLEKQLGKKVSVRQINNVSPESCAEVIRQAAADGADMVFTTSPVLLDGALKAALKLPNVKIMNCSLRPMYHTVRSYYLRVYEAKFVLGAVAGAMAENDRIGYIADYPVYGIPASINAFALGARFTNPRAKVYLEWSTRKNSIPENNLQDKDVHIISNRDIAAPSYESTAFGLYQNTDGKLKNLAMPILNWGRLYEDLLNRVFSGLWDTDASNQALDYWWGMDTGAIDVYYSAKLDVGTQRLCETLMKGIRNGDILPFSGQIISTDGVERCKINESLTPAQIVAMDWLVDNVIGEIPDVKDLKPEALPFVMLQGLRTGDAPDISRTDWTKNSK